MFCLFQKILDSVNINSLPDGGTKLKALIDKHTSDIYQLDRKIKAAIATLPQGKIMISDSNGYF